MSVIALVTSLWAAAASAQVADRKPVDPDDIRALESNLMTAVHTHDRATLERLLASDYVLRAVPDIDRAVWITNAVTQCWGDRSDIDAFHARRYDDVVIASFELTFFMDPTTCRPGVLRSLITDVWVHERDGWRLKVRHAAAPPLPDADLAAQYGVVPEQPPTWEATNELSVVATGGNTSTRTIGLGAELVHRTDGSRTDVSTKFLTAQADSETRARSLTLQARHGFRVTERLQAFGEASYARDRFAGIDGRGIFTAGVAQTVSSAAMHSFTLQGGLGMTLEHHVDGTTLRFATATGQLEDRLTLVRGTELAEELTVHADLQTAGNWRATNSLSLRVSVTRLLSLRASHGYEYRNTPVAGFGRTDMRTAMTLVFSFARHPAAR